VKRTFVVILYTTPLTIAVPYVPDKSEPSAFSRKTITGNVDVSDFSTSLEHSPQVFGRRPVGEVVDFQGYHTLNPRRRSAVAHREYTAFALTGSSGTRKSTLRKISSDRVYRITTTIRAAIVQISDYKNVE